MSEATLSAAAIVDARGALPAEFRDSPQFVSDELSERAGAPVIVKVETTNPIRSFKGRGTWTAVTALVRSGRIGPSRGVATISTGNFGLGVAYAARAHELPSLVVLPRGANPVKVAMLRRIGARLVELAPGGDGPAVLAEIAEREGFEVLRDGHDDRIAAGAGTLAAEITDGTAGGALPDMEAAYVPIGDGSLIAGVGTWLRHAAPRARVIGVQVDSAPAMARSWTSGRVEVVPPAHTRADGLASGSGNADLQATLRRVVDDVVLVREDDLLAGQREVHGAISIAAEASAAASWLAARDAAAGHSGAARLVVVTGANPWPGDFASS